MAPSQHVHFLDTDAMDAAELRTHDAAHGNVYNPAEARVCIALLGACLACGVPPSEVALISPYRAQLKHIQTLLPRAASEVELLTVDRCQGRDYACCIVTLVRSNDRAESGALLSDFRRLNVAFTRAKRKMVVVGSATTLSNSPLLATFLDLTRAQGGLLALPPEADQLYEMPVPPPPLAAAPPSGRGERASAAEKSARATLQGASASRAVCVAADRPITANILQEAHNHPPTVVPAPARGADAAVAAADW